MRPDDRRFGRQRRLDVEDDVGVCDIQPSRTGLGLPASLEIEGERVDGAEMLDRLLARPEPEGVGVETEGGDRGRREQGEAIRRAPRPRPCP